MQTSELEQNKHAVLPEPNHDELARQQFVRSFKEHLVAQVHPGNRLAYENRVKPVFAKEHGREPESRFEIRDVMTRDPHYRMFSALLRTSQEMMWSASQHHFFSDPSIDKLPAMLMGLAGMQDDDEAPYSQALELVTGVND